MAPLILSVGDDATEQALTQTFAALANPARRIILAQLAEGEATVNELAEPLDMTLPAVSKHLGVLQRAGLVEKGQRAQFRPCTLNAAPLEAVASWAEQYRPIWEERFDRMQAYLGDLQESSAGQTNPDQLKKAPSP